MLHCEQAIDRRERLRRLALETIDLAKDPYFMRNHLGQYECRLCLTLHNNEGNYLAHTQAWPAILNPQCHHSSLDCAAVDAHALQCSREKKAEAMGSAQRPGSKYHGRPSLSTQGKRHQQNLAKRAAFEAQDRPAVPAPQEAHGQEQRREDRAAGVPRHEAVRPRTPPAVAAVSGEGWASAPFCTALPWRLPRPSGLFCFPAKNFTGGAEHYLSPS